MDLDLNFKNKYKNFAKILESEYLLFKYLFNNIKDILDMCEFVKILELVIMIHPSKFAIGFFFTIDNTGQ